jgi:hypothetical protein
MKLRKQVRIMAVLTTLPLAASLGNAQPAHARERSAAQTWCETSGYTWDAVLGCASNRCPFSGGGTAAPNTLVGCHTSDGARHMCYCSGWSGSWVVVAGPTLTPVPLAIPNPAPPLAPTK